MKSENEISQILDITRPIIINGNSISEKTNLLIKKILYLIENNLFEKDSILTLTFSKTSAKSIAESIENNLENYSNIFSCLDFAKKLYCDYFNLIPEVDKSYKILNSQYSNYFFQKNIKEFELSSIKLKNNFVLVAKELYETIFKLRNKAIKLNDLEKLEVKNINQKIDIFSTYAKYEQYKKRNNFIDEQDIFFHLTSLLKRDKIIREEIQKKYSYILVNEFHYLTKLELDFLSLIINKDNITIFNDSNLCSTLNQNDSILFIDSLENSKIINLNKKLDTSLDILKLNCISSKSEKSQLNFIFEKIEIIKHKNESLGIFFKDIFQLELVSNNLNRLNIFHSKNLPLNFRTNQMIKEILCILEIIINPKEANLSLFFLLSQLPIRKETLKLISRKASLNEKSLFLVLENNAEISEYKNENEIILTFFNKIKLLIRLYESKLSYKKLVYKIISLFDFYSIADLNNNVENIYALNSFIQDFENYVSIFHNSSIEDYLEFSKLSQNININNFNSYQADSKVQLHLINNNIYEDYDNIIIPYFDKEIFSANTNKSNFEIFDNNINNNINFNKNILNYEKIFFDKIISKSRFSISFLSLEKNYKESKLLISNLINKTNYEINEINYLNKANLYNIEIKEKER
ncbi:MAG: ATP-dependent helicase [Nanoarchaeota archaeon]|nr:ATP-dependent helicase [Nanoarchaeota archaeon]